MANLSVVDMLRNNSLNGMIDINESSKMSRIGNFIMIGTMFLTMLSLGCTMEIAKIKGHIVKPKGVGIAIVSQYGIMPLTAFCLAKVFQLPEMAAVVVLICGCSPGGLLSNVMSLALRGDMNLSIVMTSCSTVLAFGMMPLLLFLYCQGFEGLQEAVPYKDIALSLLSILIPCGIGILLNHYRPQYSNIITKVGLIISTICFVVVTTLTVLDEGEKVLTVVSPSMMTIAFLMPMIGYTLGYLFSFLFRLSQECRTVSMETGCQNGPLCMALVKVAFPPQFGPLFLYPLIYVFSQLCDATLLVLLFRSHQCWQQHKNKKGEEFITPKLLKNIYREQDSCQPCYNDFT
uniref:Uncharacterized protein n=1 Tax=Periophthalmus magnuspinnatus TaxID=409849 RepID=A0A3B4BEC5_9GOBI